MQYYATNNFTFEIHVVWIEFETNQNFKMHFLNKYAMPKVPNLDNN